MPKIKSGEKSESWGYYPNGEFQAGGDPDSDLMAFVRSLRRWVREGWSPQQVAERISASEFEGAFLPEILDEWARAHAWQGVRYGRHIEGTVAVARFQRKRSGGERVDPADVRKLVETLVSHMG